MIRKYEICPKCGKPYRDHFSRFNGAEEREQEAIENQRGLPKVKFLDWLIDQRQEYLTLIDETHRAIVSEQKTVNIENMALLNVWYNWIDIYDAEIEALENPGESFESFLVNVPTVKKRAFCKKLADEFAGAKGLSVRFMIEALKELKYISFGDRQNTKVIEALKELFGSDVGSRQGIFSLKLDDEIIRQQYEPNIEAAKIKIESLIKELSL